MRRKIRVGIVLSLLCMLLVQMSVKAYDQWSFDGDNNEVTGYKGSRNVDIPDKILSVTMRAIGEGAFQGGNFLSVKIPYTITNIKKDAFKNSISINSITFKKPSEESVNGGLTTIGEEAFYGCTGLTSFPFPSTVTSIGESAFENSGLSGTLDLSSCQCSLSPRTFANCKNITEIILPEGITEIPANCFEGCTSLQNVILPSSVTTIADKAFSGCIGLTSITIPKSVKSIADDAFDQSGLITVHTCKKSYADVYYSNKAGIENITDAPDPDPAPNWTLAGEGTVQNPFQISTASQLDEMQATFNIDGQEHSGTYSGKYYAITADIDLSSICHKVGETYTNEISWTAIGSASNPFNGHILGNGHTISGLYINAPEKDEQGLFGYLGENGSVDKLILLNCSVNAKSKVGSIAGTNKGTITNCMTHGKISGESYIGGFAGACNSGSITACLNVGSVSGTSNMGAITGNCDSATIKNCFYDKQMCSVCGINNTDEIGAAEGKTAKEMTSWILFSDNNAADWNQALGRYPIPKGMEISDAAIVCATPVIFHDDEKANDVKSAFSISVQNNVTWQSSNNNIVEIREGDIILKAPGTVTFTASKGTAKKIVDITIASDAKLTEQTIICENGDVRVIVRNKDGGVTTTDTKPDGSKTVTYTDSTGKIISVVYYDNKGKVCNPDKNPDQKPDQKNGLASPVIKAELTSKTQIKITWEKVENATSYRVYRRIGKGRYSLKKETTSLSYTEKGTAGKTYTYKVIAIQDEISTGNLFAGSYSNEVSIAPMNYKKQAKIKSLTKAKKGFSVKLQSTVTGATGYQLQYSLNSGFKKAKTKNLTTTTGKVTKLQSRKKYYVRVRAYNIVSGKKQYSKWSKTSTVKTK